MSFDRSRELEVVIIMPNLVLFYQKRSPNQQTPAQHLLPPKPDVASAILQDSTLLSDIISREIPKIEINVSLSGVVKK